MSVTFGLVNFTIIFLTVVAFVVSGHTFPDLSIMHCSTTSQTLIFKFVFKILFRTVHKRKHFLQTRL